MLTFQIWSLFQKVIDAHESKQEIRNVVSFIEMTDNLPSITKTCLSKYTENFTTKKMKIFWYKKSDIFHISAQNIDCGYSLEPSQRGGSNEYPQSMFLSRNKKNNVYPVNPSFFYIKVGFKGVKTI